MSEYVTTEEYNMLLKMLEAYEVRDEAARRLLLAVCEEVKTLKASSALELEIERFLDRRSF